MKHPPAGLALAFAFLATAGCGGSKPSAAAPKPAGPTCVDAAANAHERFVEAMAGQSGADTIAAMARDLIIERCPADGWSVEVRTCMTAATTHDELEACRGQLTPDQSSRLEAAMKERFGEGAGEGKGAAEDKESPMMAPPGQSAPSRSAPPSDPCGGGE